MTFHISVFYVFNIRVDTLLHVAACSKVKLKNVPKLTMVENETSCSSAHTFQNLFFIL